MKSGRATKVCPLCSEEKCTSDYNKNKSRKDGLQAYCRPCNQLYKRQQRSTSTKAYEKELQYNRLRQREYRANNPEYLELQRAWRAGGKGAYHCALRRARTLQATIGDYESEILQMYELCQDINKVSPDSYHVDHIVPLAGKNVCGLHVPWNLQILPSDLNQRKSNKETY